MKEKKSIVIKWYRLENWLYRHRLIKCSWLIYHLMQLLFGCSIPPSVEMEAGVDIPHFHGIVIHQDTIIGDNTLIYQNVTIGGRNRKTGIKIGKNCCIGAGACILGNITIGDNVNVGANAVVLNDLPSNCTAVGVPAHIIKVEKSNENLVSSRGV